MKNCIANSTNTINLFCGNCLDIMPNLDDKSIDLILCDLPYGTTVNQWDQIIPFHLLWKQYNRILVDNGAVVLTSSEPFTSLLITSNLKRFKCEWIWKKTVSSGSLNVKKVPLKNHESVLVFAGNTGKTVYYPQMTAGKPYKVKPSQFNESNYGQQTRPELINNGTRYPLSIVEIPNPRIKNSHPTQKPVALMEYFINTYSQPGNVILDNCMGSGTTGEACSNSGRIFIGIEINKDFFNFSVKRLLNFTGNMCHKNGSISE